MAELLKNHFDEPLVELFASEARATYPDFDPESFKRRTLTAFPDLELKDRINLIADALRDGLPHDYSTAIVHVVEMAPGIRGPSGMEGWPLCSVVERHGVDHPSDSLAAMEQLTQHFSCEFAIRPFLEHHLDQTLTACRRWLAHPEATVRRLPSEGTRPYLPWGPKVDSLLDDPEIGIALITELRHDVDEVVRRSVANHLNDIARNHGDRVAEIAAAWTTEAGTDPQMVRHSLRGLVKKGHPGAMAALGFTTEAKVAIAEFSVAPAEISLGAAVDLTAALTSTASMDQRLIVDFVIHHVNANGATSPKVFKWTTIDLAPGETVILSKRRKIATASTRRYHAGIHQVDLQIAGEAHAKSAFTLTNSSS
jgi:3-methyladenine DNA glycosylase AlkC